jgi:hypothetical protein
MKQLSPSARRLFELARGQDEPDASARNRVAHSLAAKIASGVTLGAVGASASVSAAGLVAMAVKGALVVGIAGVAAGGGWLALRSARPVTPSAVVHHAAARSVEPMAKPRVGEDPPPESPPPETDQGRVLAHRKPGRPAFRVEAPTSPPVAAPVAPDVLRAETEALRSAQQALRDGASERALRLLDEQDRRFLAPRSAQPVTPSVAVHHTAPPSVEGIAKPHVDEEPAPELSPLEIDQDRVLLHRKPGRPTSRMESSASFPMTAPVAPDVLRAETEALRSAQQALRDGAPERALRLLDEQDRRFRDGLLQQERAAARVLALCQAGMVREARAHAIRFERLWPKSALLGRIRAACVPP